MVSSHLVPLAGASSASVPLGRLRLLRRRYQLPGSLFPSRGTTKARRGTPRCARTKTAMLNTTPDRLPGMPSQPTIVQNQPAKEGRTIGAPKLELLAATKTGAEHWEGQRRGTWVDSEQSQCHADKRQKALKCNQQYNHCNGRTCPADLLTNCPCASHSPVICKLNRHMLTIGA